VKPAISKDVPTGELQARLAAIADSINSATIRKTLEGTITFWSPAAARSFGHTAGEMIGQSSSWLKCFSSLLKAGEKLAGNKIRPWKLIE
jgi:PAS domain S-box-containing protein